MLRRLSAVFAALLVVTTGFVAQAVDNHIYIEVPTDCGEPPAVSALEPLYKAASLVTSQSRSRISAEQAVSALRTVPANVSVAAYMQAFQIPAVTAYQVAELNNASRVNQETLVQGATQKFREPCADLLPEPKVPQSHLRWYKIAPKFKESREIFNLDSLKPYNKEHGEEYVDRALDIELLLKEPEIQKLLERDPELRQKIERLQKHDK